MGAEKVKLPNLGTEIPLPLRICLATYEPKAFQMLLTVFSSRAYVCTDKNLLDVMLSKR